MYPLASATTTRFATPAVTDGVKLPTVAELPLILPLIVAETVNPVNVPTLVILGWAAVVTVPAVVAVAAFPEIFV